jgi:uncharacterized membrane-anchored protein YhcB (DUF1043 family)
MDFYDLESKRKCEEAIRMNKEQELRAWAEIIIAIAILVVAVGFIYNLSKIPKELRSGIYKQITDYKSSIENRADQLESAFDNHMKELDKKQNRYLKQMETLCNQTKSQGISTKESSQQSQTYRNRGYISSSLGY